MLSKAIDGEFRTFEVDLHGSDDTFWVYAYDADESFEAHPFQFASYESAKSTFGLFATLIAEEPVLPTDTAFEFADRVLSRLATVLDDPPTG